jgi:hypothetical protein
MDMNEPNLDPRYMDVEEELVDHGIAGINDLYILPPELLATFGCIGKARARRLHEYVKDRLWSLIYPGEGSQAVGGVKKDGMLEVVEVTRTDKGKGRLLKEESQEFALEWPSSNEGGRGTQSGGNNELPPIEVLDDDDGATTETSE